MRSRLLLPITIPVLVILTCAWIALYPLMTGPREHLGISFLLGSLYGHCTLASGWIALGPCGWRRLPLALVWLFAFPCAFFINMTVYAHSDIPWEVYHSAVFIILWVQVLAWPMRGWLGLRISKSIGKNERSSESLVSRQFGIQHLLVVTTAVAAIMGSGRLIFPHLLKLLDGDELAIFAFLVVAACMICVPTAFSILGMRKPAIPTLLLFAFTAFATYCELPILASLSLAVGGPDRLHIILINTFSLLPIVIVCIALRLAGYQLSAMIEREEHKCEPLVKVN